MPPEDYPEAIRRWMTQHAPAAACPLCRKAGDWQVSGVMDFTSGPLALSLVPLVCRNCAHAEFLDAYVLGVAG
jgi:hypothetical protein